MGTLPSSRSARNRFTPTLRTEVAARYGLPPDALAPLDGFESFIYRTELPGGPAILRVGPPL